MKQLNLDFGDLEKEPSMEDAYTVVWIVDNSTRKTIKDAARFGSIEHVFTDIDLKKVDLVEHAREVLKDFREGDYLCIIGDPKLSAICVGVIAQSSPGIELNVLQFDARAFQYENIVLNF
jgi:hypothetical protein